MKALFTVALVIGGLMVYETETNFPAHANLQHRAIPAVIYLVVLVILAAWAKARQNGRSNSMRSSRGGSSYQRGRSTYWY